MKPTENTDKNHKIAAGSVKLFRTCGIRSVSMNDVEEKLGMSKSALNMPYRLRRCLINVNHH